MTTQRSTGCPLYTSLYLHSHRMFKHELYSYRTASCTHTLSCRIQVLRKRHQLPDKDVARLYRILHIYSLGFHQVVGEVTLHADHRQPLLLAVWRAFSQLWQDALQVSFVPPNSSHIAGSSAPPPSPPVRPQPPSPHLSKRALCAGLSQASSTSTGQSCRACLTEQSCLLPCPTSHLVSDYAPANCLESIMVHSSTACARDSRSVTPCAEGQHLVYQCMVLDNASYTWTCV